MQYLVIAFSSRSLAMQAQNIFTRRGIPATLINTPREVDGSCGLSLRTNSRYRDAALRAVETTLLKTSVKAGGRADRPSAFGRKKRALSHKIAPLSAQKRQ